MNRVMGVDAYTKGWVAVSLQGGSLSGVAVWPTFEDLVRSSSEVDVIAVDIPIGLPLSRPREADTLARRFVGGSASSVFPTLPREVLEAETYPEACAAALRVSGRSISKQSYALRPKIMEVDAIARDDERIFKVHPEVSFAQMNGDSLAASKKSWNGIMVRRSLLSSQGIEVPDGLQAAGSAPADDVLDACSAAWSADRIHRKAALSFPDPPDEIDGRKAAIWF